MTILERLENADQARTWPDNIPTKYLYSYGVAGERFFREIKENGRLMAAKCNSCKLTYLPPRLYCEQCFGELKDWTKIEPTGEVYSYTLAHIEPDRKRLKQPRVLAFIRFRDIHGGLVHELGNVSAKRVKIGLKVKARFKAKAKRTGSITDIDYFEPA